MTAKLTSEAALRIAVAARSLRGADVKCLLEVLIRAIGYPLSCERLESLNMARLQLAAQKKLGPLEARELSEALAYLRGERKIEIVDMPIPAPQCAAMPQSIRVAIVSDFSDMADVSLSECNRILVYQLSRDDSALIAERHFARQETARSSELMVQRIALIADCNVVFASMIGARSVPLLVKAGVHPLTCQRGDRAPHLLESLQGVLRDGTPPWLVKRMDCSHRLGDETLACAA